MTKHNVRIYRSLYGTRGYIPPGADAVAELCDVPIGTFLDQMSGKLPDVDDKDNGYVPHLAAANFTNEGTPSYYLSDLTPVGIYRPTLQCSIIVPLDVRILWLNICSECRVARDDRDGIDIPKLADAWHPAHARGLRNFAAHYSTLLTEGEAKVPADLVMINGEGNYIPDNVKLAHV